MTPQPYLTELAIAYFKGIEKILKGRGMDKDDFNIELSMLASEYAKYEDAMTQAKTHGFYNQYPNKTFQVNAFETVSKNSFNNVLKLSPKFGLTPQDFEKIKGAIEEPKKESKLKKYVHS